MADEAGMESSLAEVCLLFDDSTSPAVAVVTLVLEVSPFFEASKKLTMDLTDLPPLAAALLLSLPRGGRFKLEEKLAGRPRRSILRSSILSSLPVVARVGLVGCLTLLVVLSSMMGTNLSDVDNTSLIPKVRYAEKRKQRSEMQDERKSW